MKLFNPKTIARHIDVNSVIPSEHLVVLEKWRELIKSGRIRNYKETAFHGEFKSRIVESVLGYVGPGEAHKHSVSQEQAILKGSVDLAFGNFQGTSGQVLAPFELKDANTDPDAIMPGRAKSPVQQAWEYATNAPGVKWVLVSNYLEIRLYGFGEGTQAYEHFDLSRLTEPTEYARFMLLLSAENLLSGKTVELLNESRREDKDITDALYTDYKTMRSTLIFSIRQQAPDLEPLDAITAAQTVLDRVLFTAFAEDTGLLPDSILERAFEHSDPFNPRPVWENFKGLFTAINSGNQSLDVPPYNGGLFAPDSIVDQLNIPDEVCEKFKDIGAYDFASEISVTVLGHIFEQSIADVERLQAEARGEETEPEKKTGTSGRRKRDGVVYTPDYIARFIVDQTLGVHLKEIFGGVVKEFAQKGADPDKYEKIKWKRKTAELEAWEAYRDRLKTLRIVDPACGSGVFLVMAFDFMKAELARVNDKITDMRGGAADLFDPDSEILTNNLFGVDVNAESIEIAKLSLWVKTARRGKPLDSLDANLKVGDSLIEDSNYAYLSHGFTWATAFPDVIAEGGFDIVLGNPPYVRMELLKTMKPYLEKRFEVVSDRADLYCYFFERGLNLLKPGGRLGYISSSTFFKTGSGKPLRDFLRARATLETVVDFGDLQIFEGVTTYPAILTMRREESGKDHTLRFWKIETLPEANFRASFEKKAEPYPQGALSSGSWELESPALKALRDKIKKGRKTLKELYGPPLYGIKTGLNEAFVIDTPTKNRLCEEDPRSVELLKPFLEGKDIRRWRQESRGLWLILLAKGWTKQNSALSDELSNWNWFIDNYSALADWLSNFEERARKRSDMGDFWWELRACDYYDLYERPKIIFAHFQSEPLYFLDHARLYTNNRGYIWEGGFFELALLNSRTIWFFITRETSVLRGGFFEATTQNTTRVPIPFATDAQRAQLAALAETCQTAAETRYALQQAITRRIPDLAPADIESKLSNKLKAWWELPDFSAFQKEVKKSLKTDIPLAERNDWEDWIAQDKAEITRLSAEIKANEDRINAIVYELFELTSEEIELLEANI